jgi:hypothetical protein
VEALATQLRNVFGDHENYLDIGHLILFILMSLRVCQSTVQILRRAGPYGDGPVDWTSLSKRQVTSEAPRVEGVRLLLFFHPHQLLDYAVTPLYRKVHKPLQTGSQRGTQSSLPHTSDKFGAHIPIFGEPRALRRVVSLHLGDLFDLFG